jgi:hypothetical protein
MPPPLMTAAGVGRTRRSGRSWAASDKAPHRIAAPVAQAAAVLDKCRSLRMFVTNLLREGRR